jgi:hypothetical protein
VRERLDARQHNAAQQGAPIPLGKKWAFPMA